MRAARLPQDGSVACSSPEGDEDSDWPDIVRAKEVRSDCDDRLPADNQGFGDSHSPGHDHAHALD